MVNRRQNTGLLASAITGAAMKDPSFTVPVSFTHAIVLGVPSDLPVHQTDPLEYLRYLCMTAAITRKLSDQIEAVSLLTSMVSTEAFLLAPYTECSTFFKHERSITDSRHRILPFETICEKVDKAHKSFDRYAKSAANKSAFALAQSLARAIAITIVYGMIGQDHSFVPTEPLLSPRNGTNAFPDLPDADAICRDVWHTMTFNAILDSMKSIPPATSGGNERLYLFNVQRCLMDGLEDVNMFFAVLPDDLRLIIEVARAHIAARALGTKEIPFPHADLLSLANLAMDSFVPFKPSAGFVNGLPDVPTRLTMLETSVYGRSVWEQVKKSLTFYKITPLTAIKDTFRVIPVHQRSLSTATTFPILGALIIQHCPYYEQGDAMVVRALQSFNTVDSSWLTFQMRAFGPLAGQFFQTQPAVESAVRVVEDAIGISQKTPLIAWRDDLATADLKGPCGTPATPKRRVLTDDELMLLAMSTARRVILKFPANKSEFQNSNGKWTLVYEGDRLRMALDPVLKTGEITDTVIRTSSVPAFLAATVAEQLHPVGLQSDHISFFKMLSTMRESTSISFPSGASEATAMARHGISELLDGKLAPVEVTWPNMTYVHKASVGHGGMTEIGAFETELLKVSLQPSIARALDSIAVMLRVKLPMSVACDISFYEYVRDIARVGFADPSVSTPAFDRSKAVFFGPAMTEKAFQGVFPEAVKATSLMLTSYISMYLTSQGGFAMAMDLLDDGLRTYSLDDTAKQISMPHYYDTESATLVADAIFAVLKQAAAVLCVNPMMRAALDASSDAEYTDVTSVTKSNLRMALAQRGNG